MQIARFGYKAANTISGVGATRVKHVRKCAFSPTLDVFEYCVPEVQEELKLGRLKSREKKMDDDDRKERLIQESFGKSDMEVDEGASGKLGEQLVPSWMSGIPEGQGFKKEYVNNPEGKELKV